MRNSVLCVVILAVGVSVPAQEKRLKSVDDPRRPAATSKTRAPLPKMGLLIVTADRVGTTVELFALKGTKVVPRGSRTIDESGTCTFDVPAGRYRIVARYAEYRDFSNDVAVSVGKREQIRSTLVPTFGHVVLVGPDLARDVTIRLDGTEPSAGLVAYETADRIRIKTTPGEHVVRVERGGFVPFEARILVAPGGADATPVTLERALAAISIVSTPGARVYVDAKPRLAIPGTGRLNLQDLTPAEPHEVRVELEDHEPFVERVVPALDKPLVVEAKLVPLPTSAPFEDSFHGDGSLWALPPAWSVANGVLEVKGPFAIGTPKGLRYRDSQIVFNLQMSDPRGAAWMVRASDSGDGYLFYLSGPKGRWPNELRAYVCRAGVVDLDAPASAPLPIIPALEAGGYYQVRVRVSGFTIEHWLKSGGRERQIGLFRDPKRAFASGSFGFTTIDSSPFRVNLVSIAPESQ